MDILQNIVIKQTLNNETILSHSALLYTPYNLTKFSRQTAYLAAAAMKKHCIDHARRNAKLERIFRRLARNWESAQ